MFKIEEATAPPSFALFELGFRPFFSAAGLFALIAMLVWMLVYVFSLPASPAGLSPTFWHAHEMIYGYAMAVVAGFLLTAVGNWTGITTVRGSLLAALLMLWLIARLAYFLPTVSALWLSATADILFMLGLIVAVSLPVIRVKQWKQLGIVSKLWLILAANVVFYAGAMGVIHQGIMWGLYSGLYLILALVFVMARRVMPFFIERGVDEKFSPRNRRSIDIGSLVLLLLWAMLDVFTKQAVLVMWLSLALFITHVWRMWDWHTAGIWRKPLLWSLYLGYGFIVFGFLLKALSVWPGISPTLALHAFAVGGIGLMTIAMMSRVALGHTGRGIFNPPRIVTPVFALIAASAVARVVMPIFDGSHYVLWIAVSQTLWILSFGLFSASYIPILIQPRVDGRRG